MAVAPNAPLSATSLRRAFARDFAHRAKLFHRLASNHRLNPDDVHDLRVTTRRLRASIAVLRRVGAPVKTSRAREELRALGRLLGECRMLDVAIEDAARYRMSAARLERRRTRARAALARALSPSRVDALHALLQDLRATTHDARVEKLAKRLARMQSRVDRRLVAAPPRTARARHALRIEMKKTRYLIEAFGRESPALRRLQDALGREHDLAVMQSMLGHNPRAARDEAVERSRAVRAMEPALRSAKRHLQAIRAALQR